MFGEPAVLHEEAGGSIQHTGRDAPLYEVIAVDRFIRL